MCGRFLTGFAKCMGSGYVGGRNLVSTYKRREYAVRQILGLFQQKVSVVFSQNGWQYWEPLEIAAQLFEEGGEVAREIHFLCGTKKKREGEPDGDAEAEIGDVLHALACFANGNGYHLAAAFDHGTYGEPDKYQSRSPLSILTQLAQRVGTFIDEVDSLCAKEELDQFDHDMIEIRMGNILRILECLAERIDCSIAGAAQKSIEKITGKDRYRFPKGR